MEMMSVRFSKSHHWKNMRILKSALLESNVTRVTVLPSQTGGANISGSNADVVHARMALPYGFSPIPR